MSALLEELDYRQTPMGELVLRRRQLLSMEGRVIYEVKLGEAYLMSSLFHASETALADIALAELGGSGLNVVVGGLGLGYTAAAALRYDRVKRLVVIEALEPVIDWHRQGLVPNSDVLTSDSRCVFHHDDFFALARSWGFDPHSPGVRFDGILLDIDHAPDYLLHTSHGRFYTRAGLEQLQRFLQPGGIFALWSNDPPDKDFLQILAGVFDRAEGRVIAFENPMQQSAAENGIYIGQKTA